MILLNKISLAFIFWSCLCAVIVVLFVIPSISGIYSVGLDITSQREIIAANAARASDLEKFKFFLKREQNNLLKTEKLFVDSQVPLDFIGFLESAAVAAGVNLEISPNTVIENAKKNSWLFLSFRLALSGDFNAIEKFIKAVESGDYLVNVSNVTITAKAPQKKGFARAQNEENPGQIKPAASVLLTVYAKNEKK